MQKQALKFVIVGHVDHGKSTLIGRLLYDTNSLPPDRIEEIKRTSEELGRETEFAYLLDHLEEERKQGITIDTTQVFFKTDKREYVIIDAPGHVEFVKNMITGASQAEAAVLIIDANRGIEEQTRRHTTIISLLGIDQIIVVINKMDLVNFHEEAYQGFKKEMADFLKTFKMHAKEYIPISALNGDNVAKNSNNMHWYKGRTILESLGLLTNKSSTEDQPFLFSVQDIYKVDDKRIAVGRVETGHITAGQEVKILPDNNKTKITSLEKFLENPKTSSAGESIGITTKESVFLDRGNVLCEIGKEPSVSNKIRATVFWISKKGHSKNERILFRCATQEISCTIDTIHKRLNSSTLETIKEDAERIENLEIVDVTIATKKPIVAAPFKNIQEIGRFVLVQGGHIVAGGIVRNIG